MEYMIEYTVEYTVKYIRDGVYSKIYGGLYDKVQYMVKFIIKYTEFRKIRIYNIPIAQKWGILKASKNDSLKNNQLKKNLSFKV